MGYSKSNVVIVIDKLVQLCVKMLNNEILLC